MDQRVINLFHESIEAKMQVGEALAPLIASASEQIVHALLQGNKLLICGNGVSQSMGQILTNCLANRFERERPGLPAISLGMDQALHSGIADVNSYNETFAHQVRLFAQPGDILFLISPSGNASNLVQAVQAAHDREASVIALTGEHGGDIFSLLDSNDFELRANLTSLSRIHEVHMLVIFCLCDLIDEQLFGSLEQ